MIITQLKARLDARLNDRLIEMEPNYDDSISGFNEAWDIMQKVFDEATKPAANPQALRLGDDDFFLVCAVGAIVAVLIVIATITG